MSSKIDESNIADNCEYCSSSFNIFKRKKICSICNQAFCQFCVSRLAQSTRTSGRICITCKSICAPESTVDELLKVKVKHLRAVLNSFSIPTSTCKEKRDLIDLFLRNRQTFNNRLTNRPNSHNTTTSTANTRDTYNSTSNSNSNINMNTTPNTNNSNINSSNNSQQQQSYPFNETLNSFINNVQSFVSSNLGSVINPGPVPCPPPSTNPTQNRSNDNASSSSASSTSSQNFNTMYNIFSEQMPNIFSNFTTNPETNSQTTRSRSEPTSNPTSNSTQQSQSENQESKVQANIKRRASLSDLKSIEEIDSLNIKQIKEILANNFVEYKGCCERNELVEKLKSLYTSYCENKRKEQKINESETNSNSMFNSEDSDVCKICMESIMDCVLLECGHMCSCVKCGKQLAECPICRQNVVRVVRVFKS